MSGRSAVDLLFERLAAQPESEALVEGASVVSYRQLLAEVDTWKDRLRAHQVKPGSVVGFSGDFSLPGVALLLACFAERVVIALVPQEDDQDRFLADGRVSHFFSEDGSLSTQDILRGSHPLLELLREREEPGFLIFSSGSSGVPKAILHSTPRFLSKYENASKPFRTLAFLLFDHIAGLDTLFYSLFSGGLLVLPEKRTPVHICSLIDSWEIEVLPTSPSFLNLLLLSGAYRDADLSSLRIITYGSEPMNPNTLGRMNELFPGVSMIQKYGTSEFGSPRSRTRGNNDLWLKLDSDTVQMRVADGILWIRSPTTMLGYLNAPFEISDEGWICTGDRVEVDGEWIRILGRDSEMINVGGEKVFPSEIEAVLAAHPAVEDVLVTNEPNPIMGDLVVATVRTTAAPGDPQGLRRELRRHALIHLPAWKVPVRVTFVQDPLSGRRYKKQRKGPADGVS